MSTEPNREDAEPLEAAGQGGGGASQVRAYVHTVHRTEGAMLTRESCDVTDAKSGQDIKNLPCAGLDLETGDMVEVTVRLVARKAARHTPGF